MAHLDGCRCITEEERWHKTHEAVLGYIVGLRLMLMVSWWKW